MVEKMEGNHEDITFRVHWLSFTVHASPTDAMTLYDLFFRETFGDLEDLSHGGRGFKSLLKGLLEIKLYLNPINQTADYFQRRDTRASLRLYQVGLFSSLGRLPPIQL